MTQRQIKQLVRLLKDQGVSFDPGLSEIEFGEIERVFGFQFPPDLKEILRTNLPASAGFPHWRYGINSKEGKEELDFRINWPITGILSHIKDGVFWQEDWGLKPDGFENQKEVASRELKMWPKLVPVFSHRFIPTQPLEMGNPIFSVYQTDIICYGFDLSSYFAHELNFELPLSFGKVQMPKEIPHWSRMAQ